MKIKPTDGRLQFSGRIDFSNPEKPIFVFPCTSVKMKFTGSTLKVLVKNNNGYWDNYLGCILDGEQTAMKLPNEGEAALDISVKESNDNTHEILLFKRQDSCNELTFLGLELEDEAKVLELEDKPKRRIEVYGDSVSAGEVSEAVDFVGKEDPEHNGEYSNSWYSYAWLTARKLDAQIHDIAQGGIALLDHTGWFHEPNAVGMESAWDKVHYNPTYGAPTAWNFLDYIPQVVIVAIGQNDNHPEDYMKEDYESDRSQKWRSAYYGFLSNLRKVYPKAQIVCITTLLGHDPSWDKAIGQVIKEMKDERITQYIFERNGCGTPGHLRIPEAEEMAEELSTYIETLNVEGWN